VPRWTWRRYQRRMRCVAGAVKEAPAAHFFDSRGSKSIPIHHPLAMVSSHRTHGG
jgi:hypothetical protein